MYDRNSNQNDIHKRQKEGFLLYPEQRLAHF